MRWDRLAILAVTVAFWVIVAMAIYAARTVGPA